MRNASTVAGTRIDPAKIISIRYLQTAILFVNKRSEFSAKRKSNQTHFVVANWLMKTLQLGFHMQMSGSKLKQGKNLNKMNILGMR